VRLTLVLALLLALSAIGGASAAPAPATAALKSVSVKGGQLHASFNLPPGTIPYELVFYGPGYSGAQYVSALFLGPYSDLTSLTKTSLVATKLTTGAYFGEPGTYSGWLNYGPTSSCVANPTTKSYIQIARCPHHRSNVVHMTVGNILGPGALVASSGASGAYAVASASGGVNYPQDAQIRINSAPQQSVHVAWEAICSRGIQVASRGSSYDADTPDSTYIDLPLSLNLNHLPDSCTITVTAQLDGTGSLTIQVYSHAGN